MSSPTLKREFLRVCRHVGLFALARRAHRKKLIILCYHGIEATDEASWWPGVFMSQGNFAARMRVLKTHGFHVLALGDAVGRLKAGTLPANSVVITADDGYSNTPNTMLPALAEHEFPATIYVTTYYVEKQNPIFRLAVQYMFWKSQKNDLGQCAPDWGEHLETTDLREERDRRRVVWACIDHGEQECTEGQRQDILRDLGDQLGVDYETIRRAGGLTLMSASQIDQLANAGIDIQLHTHRHRFPVDRNVVLRELEENAQVLQPLVRSRLIHFCYPSGIWDDQQHPWLQEAGIKSATTCQIGFNDRDTNVYALRRYLDRDDISETEFLAEVTGFSATLRRLRSMLRRR